MKEILLLILVLTLCACEDWNDNPKNHTCNEQQMARVEKETKFCVTNTSFVNSYCYCTAIGRNCQKKQETE
jgi:hypothetical protein